VPGPLTRQYKRSHTPSSPMHRPLICSGDGSLIGHMYTLGLYVSGAAHGWNSSLLLCLALGQVRQQPAFALSASGSLKRISVPDPSAFRFSSVLAPLFPSPTWPSFVFSCGAGPPKDLGAREA
jgi:hypothetical protein